MIKILNNEGKLTQYTHEEACFELQTRLEEVSSLSQAIWNSHCDINAELRQAQDRLSTLYCILMEVCADVQQYKDKHSRLEGSHNLLLYHIKALEPYINELKTRRHAEML